MTMNHSTSTSIAIMWATLGPYHSARISAFAAALRPSGAHLWVCRMAEHSDLYSWIPVRPDNVDVQTLSRTETPTLRNSLVIAWRLHRFLRAKRIRIAFLPSFSPLPNLLSVVAAKLANCRIVLMTESWEGTAHHGAVKSLLKRHVLNLCCAALVGGSPQRQYLSRLGMKAEAIFTGYDVVDSSFFSRESERWRSIPACELPVRLPPRFILSLGRFVPKKNLPTLIRAYHQLTNDPAARDVSLVFVGNGELQDALVAEATALGLPVVTSPADGNDFPAGRCVIFYPFQQIKLTPLFFAKCEVFVLPSIHEEWGLVVNEAMASGAPVIVSRQAGCQPDLVKEGETGLTFDPRSVDELVACLQKLLNDHSHRTQLATRGQRLIAQWNLEAFAQGALGALRVCEEAH